MSECLKAYAFGVGNIDPMSRASRKAVKTISTLENLVGIHPQYPNGTLLIFADENSAKRAKNVLKSKQIDCGGISPCSVEKIYVGKSLVELMEEADEKDFPFETSVNWW